MKRIIIFILFSTVLFTYSCNTEEKKDTITVSGETTVDTSPGSCPYLTKDNKDNIVLSWIKKAGTASSIFCYAVSKDGGKTFGRPIEIPGSTNVFPHGENMPKVIFKPSGEIIAAWGAANPNPQNKYSGLVYYSQSFDEGNTWTRPKSLTSDTASFDQRYFDMALLSNGETAVTWLDNRKRWNTEGSGLYYAVTKGKNGFQEEKLISGPCCQCCRTDLFIDKNKNIHVLYRAIINDSIRDMVHIVSTDDGKTFTNPQRISPDNWVINGCPHTGPAMAENKNGLQFTWFTGGNASGIYYSNSTDSGKTFKERDAVSGKAAKHCQITTLENGAILIVWNESFPTGGKVSSRIGIEQRDINGKSITKKYITPETGNSSFPVICSINANKAVIAYTENIEEQDFVLWRQILFE